MQPARINAKRPGVNHSAPGILFFDGAGSEGSKGSCRATESALAARSPIDSFPFPGVPPAFGCMACKVQPGALTRRFRSKCRRFLVTVLDAAWIDGLR